MTPPDTNSKSIEIRWKDYIHTPKRHRVYLWLGSLTIITYFTYMVWESFQSPSALTNKVYNTGVYFLLGLVLLLRGIRVHFLRTNWFFFLDDATIRYRMVLWTRAQRLLWSDVAKIKIAFEEVYFYLKNGKTTKINLENVPDEGKIEEAKAAIQSFGRQHAIPITK